MRRLTGQRAALQDQRDAIDKLSGLPAAPSFVGDGIRHLVPAVFEPGAIGWTEHACALVETEEQTYRLDIPDDVVQLDGREAVLDDGRRIRVSLAGATSPVEAPPPRPRPL